MNGKGNFIIFEYDMKKENENEYKNVGKHLNNYISAIFDIDGFKLFKFENKIIVDAYSGYYIVDMNIKKIISFIKFEIKKIFFLKNKFFFYDSKFYIVDNIKLGKIKNIDTKNK